jgi:hypothetical protein
MLDEKVDKIIDKMCHVYDRKITYGFTEKAIVADYINDNLIIDILSSMSDEKLDEELTSINQIYRTFTKLKLNGVRLSLTAHIDYATKEIIPGLDFIESLTDSPFTFNCDSLNNGNILLERNLVVNNKYDTFKINITNLNIEIQSLNILYFISQCMVESYSTQNGLGVMARIGLSKIPLKFSESNQRIIYNLDTITKMVRAVEVLTITRKNKVDTRVRTITNTEIMNTLRALLVVKTGYGLITQFNLSDETYTLLSSMFHVPTEKEIKLMVKLIDCPIKDQSTTTELIYTPEYHELLNDFMTEYSKTENSTSKLKIK